MPKCCGRFHGGLNYAFGNDSRLCSTDLGLGVVGGAAGEDTGDFYMKGSVSVVTANAGVSTTVDHVYGLATTVSSCGVSIGKNIGTSVKIVNAVLPPVPPFPDATFSGRCNGKDSEDGELGAGSVNTCNITVNGNSTLKTSPTLYPAGPASWPSGNAVIDRVKKHCKLISTTNHPLQSDPAVVVPEIHCSLNRLMVDGNACLFHINDGGNGDAANCKDSTGADSTGPLNLFAYFPTVLLSLQGNRGFAGVLKLMAISGISIEPQSFTNRMLLVDSTIRGTRAFASSDGSTDGAPFPAGAAGRSSS